MWMTQDTAVTGTNPQNPTLAHRKAYQKFSEGDSLTDEELLGLYQVMNTLAQYSVVVPKFGIAFEVAVRDANELRGYIRARNLEVPADPVLP